MHPTTLRRYAEEYGLQTFDRRQISFQFTVDEIKPYCLKGSDKIVLGRAAEALGVCVGVIQKNCVRLGLAIAGAPVSQYLFLGALRAILGVEYLPEWNDPRFRNPKTGYRYRYDGYFKLPEGVEIIAEFMGYQHEIYPSRYIKEFSRFQALQESDRHKKELALAHGFKYLAVKDSEPFKNKAFLTEKLREIGIVIPDLVASVISE